MSSNEDKPRCWVCGKILKPIDILGDICNCCAGVSSYIARKKEVQSEDQPI